MRFLDYAAGFPDVQFVAIERLFDTRRVMSALYDAAYARRYRARDEELARWGRITRSSQWLGEVCDRFDRPIDVLDLGCGTGRYFWGLRNVNTLVGLDASEPMLAEAAHPTRGRRHQRAAASRSSRAICATHQFRDGSFDLVYSIGVLAEHVALDARDWSSASRRWLKPGGRFAFTTVDPQSPDVPMTLAAPLADAVLPLAPGPIGDALHRRLMVGRHVRRRALDSPTACAARSTIETARSVSVGRAPARPLRREAKRLSRRGSGGRRRMTLRDARVLVIGGLGFIGVNLTSKLIAGGARTTVLTPDRGRHAEQAAVFEKAGVAVVEGDLRDRDRDRRASSPASRS